MPRLTASLLLPLPTLLLAGVATAGVIVVGPPGSGAPFQDVQPAIDAAQPGDTVLVLAGVYGTAHIAKPIDLIGAGSGQVTLVAPHGEPALEVQSIGAGESVLVAGVHLSGTLLFGPPWQTVEEARLVANTGVVALQDVVCNDEVGGIRIQSTSLALIESCWAAGDAGQLDGVTGPGILIEGSTAWVMNSVVQGGQDSSWIGSPAIHCQSSVLYLAASEVTGGHGGHPFGCDLDGGAGVLMDSGGLLKAVGPGGFIHGGDAEGGFSTGTFCTFPGHGGAGVQLSGAADAILADALPVQGGLHDQEFFPGSAPPVLVEPGSDLYTHPSLYPTLSASQPTVTLGGAVALTLHGNPLGQGWIFFSLGLGVPTLFPGVDGAVILPPGSVLLATLPLGASGTASLPLAVPPVPGLLGVAAVFQGLETAAPQVAVSNPVFVTISG